ncbi:HAD family hydrolase [Desertivirga brevis]|uniref:HAD family hydrolase n=1 Tax=Desertivirga brevis TaxID=2810310 RepID=UPI001A975D1E|nr:HAD family hydrolase [Pedobacter sp. SYSU D00873]
MEANKRLNIEDIKAVIFDVDGTLYEQSRLRKKMLFILLKYYSLRPWRFKELQALYHFRIEREKRPGYSCEDLENEQYTWCSDKVNLKPEQIKQLVDRWMFNVPNQYLPGCVFPGIKELFGILKGMGLKVAIYSDYKAEDKLKAMDLEADLIISSTDPFISRLKPDPKALLYIANKFGLPPSSCLFIGDREELDGQCAMNAGMPYLIIDKKPFNTFDFYTNLIAEISPASAEVQ